jgi:lipopolysaccharide export system protein LptA
MKSFAGFLALAFLIAAPLPVLAEKADRDKPVNLEADRITVDDAKRIDILEGNVQLIQGTLIIRSDKIVVTQDLDGFQSGVATGGAGGLARFRQRREGKEEYVDGEAERIVHDGKAEKTEFFQRAHIKSGNDEVRGQYIAYDGKNETYLVTSGPSGTTAAPLPGKDSRVHAVIQPKKKPGDEETTKPGPEPTPLKATPEIADPRKE